MDGSSPISLVYYILLEMLGPFFIVNLFLAVLKIKFADIAQKEDPHILQVSYID
jgi:hypothetical protein